MKRTKHGFTLVELIIVIAVIGVLAAILIPVFSNVIDKANSKSALSDARNTVSQYVIDAMDDKGMPENIVIMVKKAGNMYLYGYNLAGDGSLFMARDGEAYKDIETDAQMIDTWSFNAKHEGEMPDLSKTDYVEEDDGAFYLVTYEGETPSASPSGNAAVKGFHGTKGVTDTQTYLCLNDRMSEDMGDDVSVYHGVLLGGTYTVDSGDGSSSGGAGGAGGTTKYTITFNPGTVADPSKVTLPNGGSVQVAEGTLFIPGNYVASYNFNPATEDGYAFDGWDKPDSFTVTENVTLTATWQEQLLVKYTLSFDANGGTLALASGVTDGMQVVRGTDITSYITGSSATKAGHHFTSWTDGENFYTSTSSGIIMNSDMTLTAVFEEDTYALNIDNNNGDATYKLGDYTAGASVTLPTAPTKDGYVFDYWKTSKAGDDTQYGATATYTMPSENVTITAVWKSKYTVEFYAYDGSKEDTQQVNAGSTITLPTTSTPEKPNTATIDYQFTGWACSLGGTFAPGDEYTVNADATFTAQWADVPKFAVSFSAGILAGNANVSGIPATFYATPTTVVNPYDYSTPTYDWPGTGSNYTFDGWEPASVVMAESTVTFTAKWVETKYFTVTFDQGTGNGMNLATLAGWTNGGELREGTLITDLVKGSTATTAADADFIGWKCGDVTYDSNYDGTIAVTSNMTFEAQFSDRKYTVTYTSGDGTGADHVQGTNYTMNQTISTLSMSACGFTAPAHMKFYRWVDQNSGLEYAEGVNYVVTGNATLKATYVDNTFTVTYVQGTPSGATLPSPATETYDVGTQTVALKESTLANYTLKGYNATNGQSEVMTLSTATVTAGTEIIVTPVWEIKTYTVSYNANGGSGEMTGETVNHGGSHTVKENTFTAPANKEFDKWTLDEAGTEDAPATITNITANVTIYAQWKDSAVGTKTITVTYYDTWNEQNAGTATVEVSGSATEVTAAEADAATGVPAYWVSSGNATISGTTATVNGERHNTEVSGDTGKDYLVLTTRAGLVKVGTKLDGNYWMLNDINNGGTNWVSLGGMNSPTDFTGVFDGNSKKITNFTANYTNTTNTMIGLFGNNVGTIRNTTLVMSSSILGYQKVGTFAGQNAGLIENCTANSSDWSVGAQNTTNTGGAAGGIAGYNSGTIRNCTTSVCQVFAYNYAGGIAGYNNADGTITGCTTYGGVNEAYNDTAPYADIQLFYAGGITGRNAGAISNCNSKFSSVVICGSKIVGGLVGQQDSTGSLTTCKVLFENGMTMHAYCVSGGAVGYNNGGTITDVHVWLANANSEFAVAGSAQYSIGTSGNLTGAWTGGITGFNNNGTITRSSCGGASGAAIYSANTGSTSYYYWMVGGIAGGNNTSGKIEQCWTYWPRLNRHTTATASNTIGCLQCVGGITGYNAGTVTNCYAQNVEYTAYAYGAGLVGYNEGTLSYSWSYIKGYATYNKNNSGDCVGYNGGTLNKVYVYDRYNTTNTNGTNISGAPSAATSLPSGFSTTYWEIISGSGPRLKNNPYGAVTIS